MILPLWIFHSFSMKILKITHISLSLESNFLFSVFIKVISIEFIINQLNLIFCLFSFSLSLLPPIKSGTGRVWFRWRHITWKVKETSNFLIVRDHHLVSACRSLSLLWIPLIIMNPFMSRGNKIDAGFNSVSFKRASKWNILLLIHFRFHSAE